MDTQSLRHGICSQLGIRLAPMIFDGVDCGARQKQNVSFNATLFGISQIWADLALIKDYDSGIHCRLYPRNRTRQKILAPNPLTTSMVKRWRADSNTTLTTNRTPVNA